MDQQQEQTHEKQYEVMALRLSVKRDETITIPYLVTGVIGDVIMKLGGIEQEVILTILTLV